VGALLADRVVLERKFGFGAEGVVTGLIRGCFCIAAETGLFQQYRRLRQSNIMKSTKIGPKSVLEPLLGHPGAMFPPRQVQERKKRPKRRSRTPPQDPSWANIGQKSFQKSFKIRIDF
jgi:hypothetical protein